MTTKKHPARLPAQDKVNETQRKSLGLGQYVARVRDPNEALPITFRSSRLNSIPRMDPVRPGATDFLQVRRVGVSC